MIKFIKIFNLKIQFHIPRTDTVDYVGKIIQIITILEEFDVSPQNYKKAFNILSKIDPDDVPMLAVALETGSSIWSNDNHFKKQKLVKVFTTSQLAKLYF